MSGHFTDTSNYAKSLNLGAQDPTQSTAYPSQEKPTTETQRYIPLQPSQPKQVPLAPMSPDTKNQALNPLISRKIPILPSGSKKRGSVTSESSKKKKQAKPSTDDNNLSTLANIATTTENELSTLSPLPSGPRPQNPDQNQLSQVDQKPQLQQAGHRPVTSCTHCRQHKIKCNASERFPSPCQRCEKMGLSCEIDPQFRPRKGSQIQSLRNDVDELKLKIEYLQRNESLIAQALAKQSHSGLRNEISSDIRKDQTSHQSSSISRFASPEINSPPTTFKTVLQRDPQLLMDRRSNSNKSSKKSESPHSIPQLLNDSAPTNSDPNDLPPFLEMSARETTPVADNTNSDSSKMKTTTTTDILEFVLGDVSISLRKANELYDRFVKDYLPFFPILSSNNASELYSQSQLLFWTVCLTACLSEAEPTLYIKLSSLIKQLAIETCWIRTPRSTHISQALLILCMWPLPNQKVLDDCSYRFVGLAKSLGYQLGLHRGKFMSEFSRTQASLPDAEKWRTRTWLGIFFAEQFWASQLGLPPSLQTDYLIENARIDKMLPKNFRSLISLSIFQAKLVNVMGSSVISPDGLMEARNRAGSLAILERELERLIFKLEIDDLTVEIYFLYVKLTICCFAFLPETPTEDQTKYVTVAYLTATRVVTLVSKILETKNLIELPIYIRQSVTYAALILFKLHLTPLLLDKYIDSARQSIVTVHRLFRNQLSAWKNVENDISRTAQVLEKLNFVLFTHPELYIKNEGIITRMRSHLTGSLFYDLVYCIHEARRRTLEEHKQGNDQQKRQSTANNGKKRPIPLPFYNQINKDDFQTITTTTPSGITITTLVPTEHAINNATANATAAGLSKPTEINGIPVSILDETGSIPSVFPPNNIARARNSTSTANFSDFRKIASKNSLNSSSLQPISSVTTGASSLKLQQNQPQPLSKSQPPFTQRSLSQPASTPLLADGLNDENNLKVENLPSDGINYSPYDLNDFGVGYPSSSLESFDINAANGDNISRTDFDAFFQQQTASWVEGNDDVLGWFDINMAPEF